MKTLQEHINESAHADKYANTPSKPINELKIGDTLYYTSTANNKEEILSGKITKITDTEIYTKGKTGEESFDLEYVDLHEYDNIKASFDYSVSVVSSSCSGIGLIASNEDILKYVLNQHIDNRIVRLQKEIAELQEVITKLEKQYYK